MGSGMSRVSSELIYANFAIIFFLHKRLNFYLKITDKILPGIYVGSLKDSQDRANLKNYHISHIVSVIEDARPNTLNKVCVRFSRKKIEKLSFDVKTFFFNNKRISNIFVYKQPIRLSRICKNIFPM